MLLKALEMDLVLGHRASRSLPSAQLLNIMVMPSSISDENFRRRKLDSCMLVVFSLGCEICKALEEQRNTSVEHHASLVQLRNTQKFWYKDCWSHLSSVLQRRGTFPISQPLLPTCISMFNI